MNKSQIQQSETYISSMFNKMSGRFEKNDSKGLNNTSLKHVNQITKCDCKTAIDVGSGAGGILEGLLDKNLEFVYGVDLSPKMIESAQKRLEDKGYSSKYEIKNGSFLNYSLSTDLDAVSFHQVLCCHPDRSGLLSKAVSMKPNVIVLTIPRRRFFMRIGVSLLSVVRKVKKGFRFYLHNPKDIDEQLKEANYELVDVYKTFMWMTRTYQLQSQ